MVCLFSIFLYRLWKLLPRRYQLQSARACGSAIAGVEPLASCRFVWVMKSAFGRKPPAHGTNGVARRVASKFRTATSHPISNSSGKVQSGLAR